MTSTCPACGATVAESSRFCGTCGASLRAAPEGAPPMAGAAEPTSAPVEAPSPPVPLVGAPPASPRRRSTLVATAAIVATVIIVVGVLAVTGAFMGSSGTNSFGPPTGSTSALGQMNSAANAYPGGPWTPVEIAGLFTPQSASGSSADFQEGFFACASVTTIDAPSTVTLYATTSAAANGTAGAWLGYYTNAAGTTLMVFNSGVSTTLMYQGTDCSDSVVGISNVTSPVTSEMAVNITNSEGGGAAFLANHPVQLKLFILFGAPTIYGSSITWAIDYSTCGAYGSSTGSGTEFTSFVNAVSGAALDNATATC
ncbi:MAG: zinc-ribbon domain-containing protein [Thermoplasmata archaeon]